MTTAKAKTINLLLNDGTLKGVISIEASSWNSGELYAAPRDSIDDLLKSEACSKFGVYLLLSDDKVYIGQSSDLAKRIRQHIIGKSWWERAVILTTSDDNLTRSDIDYLESVLIDKASHIDRIVCENKNTGNKPKVHKFREVELSQYLEEALFLMELIGISVFCEKARRKKGTGIDIGGISTTNQREIQARKEAKAFIEEQGIQINKNYNYARLQENTNVFWMNPQSLVISADWDLILNNQTKHELIVCRIPENTFHLNEGTSNVLFSRNDNPKRIDINIHADSLIERKSGIDFNRFVIKRFDYSSTTPSDTGAR